MKMSSKITLERLSEFFQLPQKDAAREMEMSLTSLKKICRAHGITRWPFRKLMSLERTIDKMNRDSSIIESISAQHVTVQKMGISSVNDSQDSSRSLKVDVNPACKHLLSSIRPMPAIPVSQEDSTDPKEVYKHNSGSPDRSMPPPPPRMPPGVANSTDMMTGRDLMTTSAGQPPWPAEKSYGQSVVPMSMVMSGSSSAHGSARPGIQTFAKGSASDAPAASLGAFQSSFASSAPQRPAILPGEAGPSECPPAEAAEGRPAFGGGASSTGGAGGAPRAAADFAADSIPTCSVCPHRMQDVLIYNWSIIWSLHNLRCAPPPPALAAAVFRRGMDAMAAHGDRRGASESSSAP